jgi:hypothetical protein
MDERPDAAELTSNLITAICDAITGWLDFMHYNACFGATAVA